MKTIPVLISFKYLRWIPQGLEHYSRGMCSGLGGLGASAACFLIPLFPFWFVRLKSCFVHSERRSTKTNQAGIKKIRDTLLTVNPPSSLSIVAYVIDMARDLKFGR